MTSQGLDTFWILVLAIIPVKLAYGVIGPVFETPSKVGLVKPTGTEEINKLKSEIKISVIAVGGIKEKNVETVLNEGTDGVAVISSIMNADNPEEVARCLCNKIVTFKPQKFQTQNFQIAK